MKNFLRNFNWNQAIGVTLIALGFILAFGSIGLFIFEKFIAACICIVLMLVCVFVVAGLMD